MKYYIIAGEASGDLHGSNLMLALQKKDPQAVIRCWGGDLMVAAGGTLVKHYRELAFMGFAEVIKNLPAILNNFKLCRTDITDFKPDVLILIDYPGFNLRMAQWAKKQGLKVIYYISPQVWAWKENRVKTIKACVDKMLVILPFEKSFYEKWHYEVEYVGHPLVKVVDDFQQQQLPPLSEWKGKKIIALLPGSRQQEIRIKLPLMLSVCSLFPDYQFVIAKAPGLDDSFYAEWISTLPNVTTVSNQTYLLLSHASAALVTSGTATLETALFGVPQIICYKGNPLSYAIAKRIIHIKYIGLANLIMDKEVVKELIQHELTSNNLRLELTKILSDENHRNKIAGDYNKLKDMLKEGGDASLHAANSIWQLISSSMPAKENTK